MHVGIHDPKIINVIPRHVPGAGDTLPGQFETVTPMRQVILSTVVRFLQTAERLLQN